MVLRSNAFYLALRFCDLLRSGIYFCVLVRTLDRDQARKNPDKAGHFLRVFPRRLVGVLYVKENVGLPL